MGLSALTDGLPVVAAEKELEHVRVPCTTRLMGVPVMEVGPGGGPAGGPIGAKTAFNTAFQRRKKQMSFSTTTHSWGTSSVPRAPQWWWRWRCYRKWEKKKKELAPCSTVLVVAAF